MTGELIHTDKGTQLSKTEYEDVDAHALNSGATGDLISLAATGNLSRLPIGSKGAFLRVVDGVPTWIVPEIISSSEHLLLTMDDNAASPVVADATGRFDQTFLDPGGVPDTNMHTVTGVVGGALGFDGIDDKIILSDESHKSVLAEGHDFTIAMWWRTNSPATSSKRILCNYSFLGTESYLEITTNSGNLSFSVKFYTGTFRTIAHTWIGGVDDAWHHYVLSRKGTVLSIYRDGGLAKFDDTADNILTLATSAGLTIGSMPNGSYVSPGFADDFRIYGTALSAEEIAALYNSGLGTAAAARYLTELDGILSAESLTDLTISRDLKGVPRSILLSFAASMFLADVDSVYLKAGEVSTVEFGVPMLSPGSITGLSLDYEITDNQSAGGLSMVVEKNDVEVWRIPIDMVVGSPKLAWITQARGVDAFVAGDRLSVFIEASSTDGNSLTIANMTALLEVVYD